MKSHNPYMSDKEFQRRWNKMLNDIEKNADFIEEELLKLDKQFREKQERIHRGRLYDLRSTYAIEKQILAEELNIK